MFKIKYMYSGLFTNNNTSELNELSNRSIVPLRLVESRFVSFDLSLEPIAVFVFELMLACVVNGASIHPVNRVRANEILMVLYSSSTTSTLVRVLARVR